MADGRSDDPIRDDPATDSGADEEIGAPRDSGGRADSAPRAPGPGARLRAARKASGLDQDEMARALNLSRRVIRALEEDDDEQLPGATFVRGYIRSWARLTGESEEPLLAAFEARSGRPGPMVQPTPWLEPPASTGALHHRPGLVMTVATLILVVAGAMVLFGIWPDALERAAPATGAGAPAAVADDRVAPRRSGPSPDSRPSALFPADAEGATAGFAPAGSGSPADAERSVEEVPDAVAQDRGSEVPVSEVPVAEVPLSEDPVAETPGTEEPVAGNVVTEVSANGSATRVFAGGEANLGLVFSGDCWVEIRDRDDRVVHRDLYRAGQVLELLGRAPFRVRLGYAPAVELSYNDSRVPLRPHTRNDVASLVIGR